MHKRLGAVGLCLFTLPFSLLVLLPFLLLGGCNDGNTAAPPVDYGPLLTALTNGVVLPANQAFVTDSNAMDVALTILEASPDAASLAAAQAAWRTARADLRRLDAVHFGPIADDAISEDIDVAPANDDAIDKVVNGTDVIDVTYVKTALGGGAKGFLGIEYLIFSADGNDAVLARLQGDGAPSRRRTFARAMGDEIVLLAQQLANDWDPMVGGYATQVLTAGHGSTRYPRQRGALDDYVGGVGYALELVVGLRLAEPLGRKTTGVPDPTLDPTTASDSAVADMTASLAGVSALYQGSGFSSRVQLMSVALDNLANSEMAACAAQVAAIPAPFASAVVDQTSVVQAAYDACKTWKGTWNTDVTSALGATLRPTDADGD